MLYWQSNAALKCVQPLTTYKLKSSYLNKYTRCLDMMGVWQLNILYMDQLFSLDAEIHVIFVNSTYFSGVYVAVGGPKI